VQNDKPKAGESAPGTGEEAGITASDQHIDSATLLRNRDLTLMLAALKKTFEISDGYDPHRNPARCMRQIRTLLSRMELREAVKHLEEDLASE
jgi:hypothetical protein